MPIGEEIICSQCGGLFIKYRVHGRVCKKCKNNNQREYRKSSGNASTRRYEKTPRGYIMRTYRNMLSRVKGILKNKRHLYESLYILPKEDFYRFCAESENFKSLWEAYVESGFDLKQAPSIDRVDSSEGYVIDNIRWITFSENSRLGATSNKRGKGEIS